MRLAGICKSLKCAKNCVHSGIKANRVVGCGNIVIYSTRNSNSGNAVEREIGSTSEGTVAAYCDDSVYIILLAGVYCFLHTLFCLELVATVGIQLSAAKTDDRIDELGGEGDDLVINKTSVSADDSNYLYSLLKSLIGYCSDSGIHSGSVSARGKYAYLLYLFHNL